MEKNTSEETPLATQKDLELLGGSLAFQIEESRQENNERFERLENEVHDVKKSIDLNTEALSMLTQELREVKKVEFTVYNHKQRITTLERK
jgi:hypothetical protein